MYNACYFYTNKNWGEIALALFTKNKQHTVFDNYTDKKKKKNVIKSANYDF